VLGECLMVSLCRAQTCTAAGCGKGVLVNMVSLDLAVAHICADIMEGMRVM
jgi:hypothetical protein